MNPDLFKEALERDLDTHKHSIELLKSLRALSRNKDFQRVITEGYFRDEAVAGVAALSAPTVDSEASRAKTLKRLDAISELQQYFTSIEIFGEESEDIIGDIEEQLTEAE